MIINSDYPINEEVFNDLIDLNSEYVILNSIEIQENNPEHKIVLPNSIEKECRFCKKSYPFVKFKNISHAIPEFIGNKSLLSEFECDSCNSFFSVFENEFANYLLPFNTISKTKTKKNKTPKYKNKIEIFTSENNVLNVKNIEENSIIDKKTIAFSVDIPSYIPEHIYRILIKIGISFIPENMINQFSKTIEWLMNPEANLTIPPNMIFTLFPFSSSIDNVRLVLFKSKPNVTRNIPDVIFSLSYRNFSFQTFFPIFPKENISNFFPFPHIIPGSLDLDKELLNRIQYNPVDLSKKERVKNDKIEFKIESLD